MKYLPKSPSFNDLQLKVGGFMMNSISTLNLPRKLPRNFEYVGGMQMERKESQIIEEVRNLPKLSMFPCSFSMQFTHRKYCTSYRNQMTVWSYGLLAQQSTLSKYQNRHWSLWVGPSLGCQTSGWLHWLTHGSEKSLECLKPMRKTVVRLLNKCYWTRSFEQNRWTKNQLNKNLLNKKSIEQVDNWTNIWLNNYPLNKCIWTKLLQQLNKSWIEQVVTFLTWLRKLRLAECVVARQRHEARGVWGACPPF